MDYQSVVVYSIINIAAPTFSEEIPKGCIGWLKDKVRRAAVYLGFLKVSENHGILHGNLACLYYRQGFIDLAIDTYREAIELHPLFPDAYCNLGNIFKEKGLVEEAEECYNKALLLCPSHVETLNNLGNVKREQGKIEEATNLYEKALRVFPKFAVAHNNLGTLLQQQGKFKESLLHYREAISIHPKFADAYSNMGNTLRGRQDRSGAEKSFKKAIDLNPQFADAHCNLACIYKDMGHFHDAIESFRKALKIQPDYPDAYCSYVHCLQVICDWEDYDEHMQNIVKILEVQLKNNKLCSVHPHHSMLYPLSNSTRKEIAARHAKVYSDRVTGVEDRIKSFFFRSIKPKNVRLRVGYVSSDFGNHPSAHLMQSIPGLHDREFVEIFCYALSPSDGTSFRAKIMEESEHFIDLSQVPCNDEAAREVFSHNIDILINMNGYTKGARNEIFALRPAPIQVMWLGYPGTSGSSYMDYIITDEMSSPMSYHSFYSEKFAYMPYTYLIGDHKQMFPHIKNRFNIKIRNEPTQGFVGVINATDNYNIDEVFNITYREDILFYENLKPLNVIIKEINLPRHVINSANNPKLQKLFVASTYVENGISIRTGNRKIASGQQRFNKSLILTTRKQYGLPEDAIVFCNFNQLYKINPYTFETWVNILKKVPNSVLWLLSFPEAGEPNLRKYLQKSGLPQKRVIFSEITGKEEHVRRGQMADICLDTPLCNGHTTTMDILWAGTPVVTLPGETLPSRVASSLLEALHCPELIATNESDYEAIAVKLGTDTHYRRYIQAKFAKARLTTSLFNCEYYTRGLERLYKKMWDRYIHDKNPDHISAY